MDTIDCKNDKWAIWIEYRRLFVNDKMLITKKTGKWVRERSSDWLTLKKRRRRRKLMNDEMDMETNLFMQLKYTHFKWTDVLCVTLGNRLWLTVQSTKKRNYIINKIIRLPPHDTINIDRISKKHKLKD